MNVFPYEHFHECQILYVNALMNDLQIHLFGLINEAHYRHIIPYD